MNYLTFSQCQASFQYSTSGLSVDFQSTSINAGSSLNSQTPTWNFGDGSPQVTGVDFVNHIFTSPGLYNVCIDIFTWPTSWTTCSDTYCDTIFIANFLSSDFIVKNNNKAIYKRFNMFGQETKDNSSEPSIIMYTDGTIEKVIQLIK